jgi:hypothetical protein
LKTLLVTFRLFFIPLFAWSLHVSAAGQIGYGYQDEGTSTGASLYAIDLTTGIASLIGDLDQKTTGSFRLINLVFAPDGTAYGYRDEGTPAGSSLYSINVATGIASLIGDLDRKTTGSFRLHELAMPPSIVAFASVNFVASVASSPRLKANDDTEKAADGAMVVIDVLANDEGLDSGPISLMVISAPTGGSAIVTAENKVIYTPAIGFSGIDSFQYSVSNRNGESSDATVTVIIVMTPTVPALANTSGQDGVQESKINPVTGAEGSDNIADQAGTASALGPMSIILLLLVAPWFRRKAK